MRTSNAQGCGCSWTPRARHIDPTSRTVTATRPDGRDEALRYDRLIIGTGAVPVRPPIVGLHELGPADGVHLLHTMTDTLSLAETLRRGPESALIVGAGYIGLEMAEDPDDLAARTIEPSRVFRRWALANRQEFALLFGTPTAAAGSAQVDVTSDWVKQLAGVWGPEFVRLWTVRPYPILADDELDPSLRKQLAEYGAATGVDIPLGALIVMLSCWRSIYGAVALEVFDHFAPMITDQEPMFELMMRELLTTMGLRSKYRPPSKNRAPSAAPRTDGPAPSGLP